MGKTKFKNKITLQEFFDYFHKGEYKKGLKTDYKDTDTKICCGIRCNTIEQVRTLLRAFDKLGYTWITGEGYLEPDSLFFNTNILQESCCFGNDGTWGYAINYAIVYNFEDIEDVTTLGAEPSYKFNLEDKVSVVSTHHIIRKYITRIKNYIEKSLFNKYEDDDFWDYICLGYDTNSLNYQKIKNAAICLTNLEEILQVFQTPVPVMTITRRLAGRYVLDMFPGVLFDEVDLIKVKGEK
nr:MAG TPA: hypothetical protein [Caudoviricetes sp.]